MVGDLLKPETFEFAARYLLAGYIVIIVRSRFIVGLRPRVADLVVEAVILSLVNQLLWLLVLIAVEAAFGSAMPARPAFFGEVLVQPTLLGALLGWNLSQGWQRAVLRRLAVPASHPVERAHDFAFHDRESCLVILTYHDGTTVRGFFGAKSLAANDAERSDLYLERLYSTDEGDQWVEPRPGRSGLFDLRSVRSIEFLDEGEAR